MDVGLLSARRWVMRETNRFRQFVHNGDRIGVTSYNRRVGVVVRRRRIIHLAQFPRNYTRHVSRMFLRRLRPMSWWMAEVMVVVLQVAAVVVVPRHLPLV